MLRNADARSVANLPELGLRGVDESRGVEGTRKSEFYIDLQSV